MTASPPNPRPGTEHPSLRAPALGFLATVLAAGAVVAVATVAAPRSAQAGLASGGAVFAVLLGAAVALAVRATRSAGLHRANAAEASREAGRLLQERDRLTGELDAERARSAEEHAHALAVLTEEHDRDRVRLLGENVRLAEKARRSAADRAAALAACANAAGRLQALSTGILADLRDMEERHSDETVLGDLLHLDHRTAQAGRLADSVAVLTGARSGRRWARPIGMESILRGAMGRIGGYRRVRVHSTSDLAVAGHAAEGVMHVLAELLDNAANFSPPTAEVHVYVEEVPAGVIVSVEDSGLVMGEVQLNRAKRAVSGESTDLGGLTGTRLGLAVVGRLARKHGLTVSFRPSARGGTGVLVLVPQELLTRASAAPRPARAARTMQLALGSGTTGGVANALPPAVSPAAATPAAATPAAATPDGTASDGGTPETAVPETGGLARRQRGQTLAAAEGNRRETLPPREAPRTDVRTGLARFSSFRQAVRGTGAPVDAAPASGQPDAEPITGRTPAASPYPEGDTPR